MKAFFLVLVLANVLLLAWLRWHTPAPSGEAVVPTAETPTLLLAGEQQEPGKTAADAQPQAAVPPQQTTGAARCQSIGPFVDLPEATQASVLLRDRGYEPRARATEGDVWAGLWVYLEKLPSRAEAQRIMGILRQNGINDAYIMPSLAQSNDISLGIFSEPSRAQRRAEDARRLGLRPLVAEHTRKGTVYWLDVDLKPADNPIDPSNLQRPSGDAQGRIVRLEIKPCS